ncbi:MAG TPA: exodeoxyribonuclease VII small subunit [Desulfuromonadales bacterium]|nr:exodeoxyribonuclease VII small subunit [Desulfuromonadales bacterium]
MAEKKKSKESFETSLHALEEVVERLESGDLTLEESLESFELGVKSAARCRKLLKEVELKVELLLKDRDGGLTLEDFNQQ